MVSIAPAPISMNDATLAIGTDNYEKTVSSAKLVPTTPVNRFKGISGDSTVSAGKPDWALQLTFAQDWTTANSLSQYLLANAGATKTIELTPSAAAVTFTVTVLIVPGDVGGDVDSTTTASVTLEVLGQPAAA